MELEAHVIATYLYPIGVTIDQHQLTPTKNEDDEFTGNFEIDGSLFEKV